ncbi:hypothetical protein [Agarivorans gilvus]|uniref:DUF2383 domain-containing protein n=1 Tax=Agarivorans gilvus TaxID=680279 RepID=A0ABQ1I380_9ALTE|nr:hypothetical protein [Agarivorans gilvus]GGB11973.1 hypothetical protein GCM10007414_26850 [Agarivorans gilvus]
MNRTACANTEDEPQFAVAIQVINLLRDHYQRCLSLIHQPLEHAVRRALERLIRVEQKAICSLANFVKKEDLKQDIIKQSSASVRLVEPSTDALLQENLALIEALKLQLQALQQPALIQLLSYWLAALQIEHDELAKHIQAQRV